MAGASEKKLVVLRCVDEVEFATTGIIYPLSGSSLDCEHVGLIVEADPITLRKYLLWVYDENPKDLGGLTVDQIMRRFDRTSDNQGEMIEFSFRKTILDKDKLSVL